MQKSQPHIQAHLDLPIHKANAENQKSLNFCKRTKEDKWN